MKATGGTHLKLLHTQLENVLYQLAQTRFSRLSGPQPWGPALNVYECENSLIICADLSGVRKSQIDLQIQGKMLLIQGEREAPEPRDEKCQALRVLMMEIDYGRFKREVHLPEQVDAANVTAEQREGLLWIYLPFRTAA